MKKGKNSLFGILLLIGIITVVLLTSSCECITMSCDCYKGCSGCGFKYDNGNVCNWQPWLCGCDGTCFPDTDRNACVVCGFDFTTCGVYSEDLKYPTGSGVLPITRRIEPYVENTDYTVTETKYRLKGPKATVETNNSFFGAVDQYNDKVRLIDRYFDAILSNDEFECTITYTIECSRDCPNIEIKYVIFNDSYGGHSTSGTSGVIALYKGTNEVTVSFEIDGADILYYRMYGAKETRNVIGGDVYFSKGEDQ